MIPDGKWVGISGRARVIVYSTENISEDELPDSIWDFADPKWKGRIGFPPTNGSFHVMVTAMRLDWGEDKTREWLEGVIANEPTFYAKNTPTVAAAAACWRGRCRLREPLLSASLLSRRGRRVRGTQLLHHLRTMPGSLVMAAGAGILSLDRRATRSRTAVEVSPRGHGATVLRDQDS